MSFRYEFRFQGRIPDQVRRELRELELEESPERAETVMVGDVEDSAALNGLLRRFELLDLDVIEVHRSRAAPRGGRSDEPADDPAEGQGSRSS